MIRLYLFGAPHIERDGQPVPLRRTKALALLAYLALVAQPRERDALLALLWPEFDEVSARNNLRRELSIVRSALDADLLAADRLQVRWNPQVDAWVDVVAFQARLAAWQRHRHPPGELCAACAAELAAASQLAGDDLLAGFVVPECQAFDEWLFFQREELRQQLAAALQALVPWHEQQGQLTQAADAARRWLALDLLHEPAHRALMRLYATSGQRAAALRQYEECARLLDAELGATPEPDTTALYDDIRARRMPVASAHAEPRAEHTPAARQLDLHAARDQAAIGRRLPPPPPGFVGRQPELADIIRRLTDRTCRLLTLVGPGGIGKTRLALQVAHALADGWEGEEAITDGVLWVPLAAVSAPSSVASAIAEAAQFDFYPTVPQRQQVIDFFRTRRMLVVLDNFEHLLDGAPFLAELLAAAPGLRLLVTSRQALNLQEEWFHPVAGLSFPAPGDEPLDTARLVRFDAIRLFEQHARRQRSDFSLSRERAHVVRLCQMVEGMPLAIELAASWLRALPAEQVVAALARDIDMLATRDRSIPPRHRSMRTVLEESWRQLDRVEQRALAALAVFRGGFSAEAAAVVAGAPLAVLAALAEKSLLRAGSDGRFQLHELLRQFAAEHPGADAQGARAARERHSRYYLGLLDELGAALTGERQTAALAAIGAEIGNIRAAWEHAAAEADLGPIDAAVDPLYTYFWLSCHYQEGLEVFELATARLGLPSGHGGDLGRVQVRVAVRWGAFAYTVGLYERARTLLHTCLEAARASGDQREQALALDILGRIAGWTGDHHEALALLGQSRDLGRAIGEVQHVAAVLQEIAEHRWDRGEFEEVRALASESLALSRRAGRPDRIGQALDGLGSALFCLGQYAAAEQQYREALAVFEGSRHQLGIAKALGGLGLIRWAQGADIPEAIRYFEQSHAMMRTIGHQRHKMDRLNDLARAHADLGESSRAAAYASEGLAAARELGSPVYIASSLCCQGWAAIGAGDYGPARAYLREAVRIAAEGGLWPVLAEAMLYTAELLVREGAPAPERQGAALALARMVLRQPTWQVFKERARRLTEALVARAADPAHTAGARGQELDWQRATELALAALAAGGEEAAAQAL